MSHHSDNQCDRPLRNIHHVIYAENDDDSVPERYDDESDFDNDLENAPYVPNYDDFEDVPQPIEMDRDEEDIEEEAIGPNRGEKYIAQDKGCNTVWWSMPTEDEKERCARMKDERLRSFAYCKENFETKIKAFMRIFPPAIVGQIVIETNRKAKRVYKANVRSNSPKRMRRWKDTDVDEVYAYFAILLFSGAEKANNVHANDLFDKSNMPFYRAVMSLDRFEQLTCFLRFDDSRTRMERLRLDKLAPIRHIWHLFQKNLVASYVPSLELTIDEQLLVTRNRFSFRQYIPSKPGKYRIRFFLGADAQTNYPVAAEIYLGQLPNHNRSKDVAHDLVLRLMNDYFHLSANITMEIFFVSYDLAEDLVSKNTTITGTIRSNKRQIPKVFASADEAKKRGENSAVFCFSNSCELVSYTGNNSKNVLLLSTAHATDEINRETGKPLIIHDYNSHKGGVDVLDQMLRGYTCKRKCYRWPMIVFFNMVDLGAFSAFHFFHFNSIFHFN